MCLHLLDRSVSSPMISTNHSLWLAEEEQEVKPEAAAAAQRHCRHAEGTYTSSTFAPEVRQWNVNQYLSFTQNKLRSVQLYFLS